MDTLILIFFVWLGLYGNVIGYFKQILFQGQDVMSDPLKYILNFRFLLSFGILFTVAMGTFLIDALIRQNINLSGMYGYANLITAPVTMLSMFVTLKLSEQYLSDTVNWWAVLLIIISVALGTIGGYYLTGVKPQ